MSSYLVTGAGRGIGLELTRQLVKLDETKVSKVFATTRGLPSEALNELISTSAGRIIYIQCEITKQETIERAVSLVDSKLAGKGLDVLVNNAGVQDRTLEGVSSVTGDQLLDVLNTNVIGAQRVTSAFLGLLRKGEGKKIFNISSTLGSITDAERFLVSPSPAYKISKAALNMLSVQYAFQLGKEGFTVLAVSPGWLRTDLGSSYADLEVDVGVRATLDIMLRANPEMNGKYLNIHVPGWEKAEGANFYDGAEVSW